MLPVKSDAGVMLECTHSTDQSVHDCDTAQNRMGDLSRSNATALQESRRTQHWSSKSRYCRCAQESHRWQHRQHDDKLIGLILRV